MKEIIENTGLENMAQAEKTISLELGDIFDEKQYPLYYQWVIDHGYTIKELDPVNGNRLFQIIKPQGEEELTYIQKRLAEYPSIGDQLDMIYWDQINGTQLWKEKITEIKNKYPKE